jgi:hypothetical protein
MTTPTMKKSLFICVTLICSSFLIAQENDTLPSTAAPSYNDELGLNISAFVTQFLSLNSNEANEGAYLITYKHIKGVRAFRLGAGIFISHTKSEGGPNSAPLKSDIFNTAFRFGLERQIPIERRWLFTAGGDILIGYDDLSTNSDSNFGTIKIKDREWSVGVGPVLGIHFRLSPRVSIGTEGTIYLRYFNSKSSTDFGGIGGGEESDKSDGVNFAIRSPLALYFAVRI